MFHALNYSGLNQTWSAIENVRIYWFVSLSGPIQFEAYRNILKSAMYWYHVVWSCNAPYILLFTAPSCSLIRLYRTSTCLTNVQERAFFKPGPFYFASHWKLHQWNPAILFHKCTVLGTCEWHSYAKMTCRKVRVFPSKVSFCFATSLEKTYRTTSSQFELTYSLGLAGLNGP